MTISREISPPEIMYSRHKKNADQLTGKCSSRAKLWAVSQSTTQQQPYTDMANSTKASPACLVAGCSDSKPREMARSKLQYLQPCFKPKRPAGCSDRRAPKTGDLVVWLQYCCQSHVLSPVLLGRKPLCLAWVCRRRLKSKALRQPVLAELSPAPARPLHAGRRWRS